MCYMLSGMEQQAVTRFNVPGAPVPQGSKNLSRSGHMYEANKKLQPWRNKIVQVARLAHKGAPIDAPVEVTAYFCVPKPKKPKFGLPATPADLDKYQRALGDALTQAGVIKDDARIVHWDAWKVFHPNGWVGVQVTVKPVQGLPWEK